MPDNADQAQSETASDSDGTGRQASSGGTNRRTILKTAGVGAATAALAGCSALLGGGDGGDGGDGGNGTSGGDGGDGGSDGGGSTDGGGGMEMPEGPLQAGLLSFTKGPASVLGMQAVRGAEKAVELINNNGGIAGKLNIKLEVKHEGDAALDKYQSFIDGGKDVTFGPISSGTHKNLAPKVESNKVVNVGTDGTVTTLYEETVPDPTYSFRFQNYDVMEVVTAALEVTNRLGADNINTVAGVNPGYAFGEDEMAIFEQAIKKLTDAEIVYKGFPDLLSKDYSTHISQINSKQPDVVFSSLWGGDASTFLEQAFSRGMFDNIEATVGTVYYGSADAISKSVLSGVEAGTILSGSRNYYWDHPSTSRSAASQSLFDEATSQEGIKVPTAHYMSGYGAVTAWATAVEKAINVLGGYPSQEQIAKTLEGHGFYTPGGYYNMCQDHQGRGNGYAGVMTWSDDVGAPVLEDTNTYSATQISPPPQGSRYSKTATDWLGAWS